MELENPDDAFNELFLKFANVKGEGGEYFAKLINKSLGFKVLPEHCGKWIIDGYPKQWVTLEWLSRDIILKSSKLSDAISCFDKTLTLKSVMWEEIS